MNLTEQVMSYSSKQVTVGGAALYLPAWHTDYNTNPSIYVSKGSSAISFTRTGGTWDKYGWTADGDDYLSYTVANWRSTDQTGTLIIWHKTSNVASDQALFTSSDQGAAGINYFDLRVRGDLGEYQFTSRTGDNDVIRFGSNANNGSWQCTGIVSNGTVWTGYQNGINQTITVAVGANSGTWLADIANRDNVFIGARFLNVAYDSYYIGTIGVVFYDPLAYTAGGMTRFYQNTKRRFTI